MQTKLKPANLSNLMNGKYIAIAETKLGFEKCVPYAHYGDASHRWLHRGGGLWDEYDVVLYVKHKMTLDRTLK